MTDDNRQICGRVLEKLFEHGNLDAVDELVHPDFVNEAPRPGKPFATAHIHIGRLEGGRVIEHWSVRDDLNHALQLGLIGD